MMRFEESGMTFEFDEDNCFRIEDEPLLATICSKNSTQNLMPCECVTVIDDHHCFIEAKKSAPKGPNGNVSDLMLNGEKMPSTWIAYNNYQRFLRDISKKFIDSYSLLRSIVENRHGKAKRDSLPLFSKDLRFDKIRFVLVINLVNVDENNVDRQLMAELSDALLNEMRPFLRLWNIPDHSVKIALPGQARRLLNLPIVDVDKGQ